MGEGTVAVDSDRCEVVRYLVWGWECGGASGDQECHGWGVGTSTRHC